MALVECAILDSPGRLTGKSIRELCASSGTRVPFYIASSRRDATPEQEVEHPQHLIDETGTKAVNK